MTMIIVMAAVTAVLSYLIGSISSAVLLSKAISGKDIRNEGSGNAGATNMLRTHGKKMGALTLLCDVVKGVAAVLLALLFEQLVTNSLTEIYLTSTMEYQTGTNAILLRYILPSYRYIAGLFVVLGHNYPVYFGFRGGKGVATSLGVVLLLNWQVGLIVLGFSLMIMLISRYVSLGSISAAVLYIAVDFTYMIFTDRFFLPELLFAVLMALLMIWRHRANIKRLKNGTENKLGQKKKAE